MDVSGIAVTAHAMQQSVLATLLQLALLSKNMAIHTAGLL
jgi:hypothetical protein